MTSRLRAPRAVLTLAVLGASVSACSPSPRAVDRVADVATAYAVHRLALDTLFNGAEHHTRIVLWATDAGDGPALEALDSMVVRPAHPRAIDAARLAAALPVRVMSERELTALFRTNPDGWAAFFRENPGAAGLVELTPVRLSADDSRAVTYVGRSCGEHCRNAWRLRARRLPGGRWGVESLRWLNAPDR